MSTFEVTLETIEVLPHPNADALELARIGGYRAVIPKGQYATGQVVIYIPEQAVLPQPLITFIGLEGRLAGKEKNRVKPVRLRGELSQGLVVSTKDVLAYLGVGNFDAQDFNWEEVGELLEITKWEPPIPVEMQGKLVHVNSIVKWPDVENIKKYPDMFEPGEQVDVTEKIHGTCCGMTYDPDTDTFSVYSKGLSQQGLALMESDTNVYWRAVKKYDLQDKLRRICKDVGNVRVALFGEVYGQGVQDLGYGLDVSKEGPGFAAFDLWIGDRYIDKGTDKEQYLPSHFSIDGGSALLEYINVPCVPLLYGGPYDYNGIEALAYGRSMLGGDHLREGVVVRPSYGNQKIHHENPNDPTKFSESRKIAKFVSEDYLLRKNATEFE